MRKTALFVFVLFCILACKDTPQYTVSGTYGAGKDTLLLFGLDSRYEKVSKILLDEQGGFRYSMSVDTIVPLGLALPDGTLLTLFAEPNVEAKLLADSVKGCGWLVKGGREQALYDSIAKILSSAESNSARLVHIDRFIKENPYSNINIEIVRRFMVDVFSPNNGFTLKRIQSMGGVLQDHEFFRSIKEKIENKNSNTLYKMFPSFDYVTIEGKRVTSRNYKDKLMVVNFWASWDAHSLAEMKNLSRMMEKVDTSKVGVLNISLDYDTVVWKKHVVEDSIAGDNVCDGKAWDNETVRRFNISNLTYTLVVSPYQRVDVYGLNNERFAQAIDSLADKYFKDKKKKNRHSK